MERSTSRHSFSCPDDDWQALDEIAEAEDFDSKSALIRSLVAEKVAEYSDEEDTDEYLPDDEEQRDVYLAALRVAGDSHRVRGEEFARLARHTQVSKGALEAVLYPLRKSGYVARVGTPANSVNPRTLYRIKPRCADPEQWVGRESQFFGDRRGSPSTEQEPNPICPPHRWVDVPDGQICQRCAELRDAPDSDADTDAESGDEQPA